MAIGAFRWPWRKSKKEPVNYAGLRPGDTLDEYRVEAVAGRGGMGTVYKIRCADDDVPLAAKVLHPNLIREGDFVTRFRTEAKIAAQLRHVNTVHVLKMRKWHGTLFYTMEFVEGAALDDMLKDGGPLPLDKALLIVRDVAAGLEHIHSQYFVHRDVKPGNVLVRPDGHVKIIDFGLAQPCGRVRRTKSGHVMGTAKYMPPELIEGTEVHPPCDIYSLGILAYELLTGKAPFEAGHSEVLMDLQLYSKPKPLADVMPGVDQNLSEFVSRMLAKKARERVQSARLVHGWLDFYLAKGWFPNLPGGDTRGV